MDKHRLWIAEAKKDQLQDAQSRLDRRIRTLEEKTWQYGASGRNKLRQEKWTLTLYGYVDKDGHNIPMLGATLSTLLSGGIVLDSGVTDINGKVALSVLVNPQYYGTDQYVGTPGGGLGVMATGYDPATIADFVHLANVDDAAKTADVILPGMTDIYGNSIAPLSGFHYIGGFCYPFTDTIVANDSIFGSIPVSITNIGGINGLTTPTPATPAYLACIGQACLAVPAINLGFGFLASGGTDIANMTYQQLGASLCPVASGTPLASDLQVNMSNLPVIGRGPAIDFTITGYVGGDPNGPYLYCSSTPVIKLSGGT